jgi:hypothetical protein
MTYRGRVANGVVVLEGDAAPPEGSEVTVALVRPRKRCLARPSLAEQLQAWAGKARGLPVDLARNHDHYLHGLPKR